MCITNYKATFIDSEHCEKCRLIENNFRKNSEFTDVILRTKDGIEFKVHKIVLASACSMFHRMFQCGMKESFQQKIDLKSDIPGKYLELLLDYIYTGQIELLHEDARIVNEYAEYFGLKNLKDFSASILIKSISIDNCLDYWRHSELFQNEDLGKFCFEFILRRSTAFFKRQLYDLSIEELQKICSANGISCSQEQLYIYITKWIKYDFDSRQFHIKSLMKSLNFNRISVNFKKENMQTDDILLRNSDFQQLVISFNIKEYPTINVLLDKHTEILISSESFYQIEFDKLIWFPVLEYGFTNYPAISTFNKNNILISGNFDSNKCEYYSNERKTVHAFPSLINNRYCHQAIELNDKIYAVGGYESSRLENINANSGIEIFDCRNEGGGSWIKGPRNIEKEKSFGVVSHENSIYLFGGLTKKNHRTRYTNLKSNFSNIVERYDPRENQFCDLGVDSPGADLTKSVCLNDMVYCFHETEINVFDIRQNRWTERMFYENYDKWFTFSLTQLGDVTYIIGNRYKVATGLSEAFASTYDLRNNVWRDLDINLGQHFSIYGLLTLYD